MSTLWAIAGFFIVLTPIVIVHELGHFWAARYFKIRVEEFGFGLPPRALTIAERNGTVFSLNWIPLGGFVRPAGEDDPTIPGGLAGASKTARLVVLSAGAAFNLIMAVLVYWLAFIIGPTAVVVTDVAPGAPAALAGLQAGDLILEVNGVRADDSAVIASPMYQLAGQNVTMLIVRNGVEQEIVVVPRLPGEYNPDIEGPIGVGLGLSAAGERINRTPLEAWGASVSAIGNYVNLFWKVPVMLIMGDISPSDARPVSIIGISQIAGQAAEVSVTHDNLFPLLRMTAFISVALGLTNLLPIPALDGGRILFVLIEAVRGRRVEPEREGAVHVAGMLFLLGLMALLIVNDLVNPLFTN